MRKRFSAHDPRWRCLVDQRARRHLSKGVKTAKPAFKIHSAELQNLTAPAESANRFIQTALSK
jgi:hypothetical protein